MKIAIIAAMSEEIEPFRNYFKSREVVFKRGKTVIERMNNIYLVESGIGKANAAATTAWLCEKFSPEIIINTGSTGSFVSYPKLGDVVIADKSLYSDVDATAFSYNWGQVPQMPAQYCLKEAIFEEVKSIFDKENLDFAIHYGTIATSDSFMSSPDSVEFIKSKIPDIVASDMESTSIAQIASFYDIPFINVRGISDYVGEKAPKTFKETLALAATNTFEAVCLLMRYYSNK